MISISRQVALLPPQPVQLPGTPIRPSTYAAIDRAPAGRGGWPRRYGDEGATSRFVGNAAGGRWKIRWHSPIEEGYVPDVVLVDGDRIVLQAGTSWQMFERATGEPVTKGRVGSAGVVMDSPNGLFYVMDPDGPLSAMRLSNGSTAYRMNLAMGDVFGRPFFARRGARMIEVGVEREAFPHRPSPPNRSFLEFFDLGEPPSRNSVGIVDNLTAGALLHVETASLVAAMSRDAVVFAVPGRVYHSSTDLHPKIALEGSFKPLALSVEASGRAHLVVEVEGRKELWVVEPDGRRPVAVPYPGDAVAPPMIGYDHRIYVVTPSRITAFEPDGKVAWTRERSGGLGGGISEDDRLVVANGREVVAYAKDGEVETIVALPEAAATAPVLVGDREIVVASKTRLYGLVR